MDVIGCEACGARLLFTTPSSWTQQQVEKAALVFSLKLDNGHKLPCPWLDNACDERLVEFPPTTPLVLFETYRERFSALFQLLALPLISSSAIEYMKLRSPQVKEFLGQSPALECGSQLDSVSYIEPLGNEAGNANLYYQAQKLISLCGWEPRLLPYVVEYKERPKQPIKDADIVNSSPNGHNLTISVHSAASEESGEANEGSGALSGLNADTNSAVLDCRLCGASVGLWTFPPIAQPIELFRLVGGTEFSNGKNSGLDSGRENHVDERVGVVSFVSNNVLSSTYRPSDFKLTIAGGPPPTRQNFKATISLPVIGLNLRARLSFDSGFRDRTYDNQDDTQSRSENWNLFLEIDDHAEHNCAEQMYQPEAARLINSTTHEKGQCDYASGNLSPCLNLGSSGKSAAKKSNTHISCDETDATRLGNSPETSQHGSVVECPVRSTLDIAQVSDGSGGLLENGNENVQKVGSLTTETGDFGISRVSVSSVPDPDARTEAQRGTEDMVQIPTSNELVAYGTGKDLKQRFLDKAMSFDPIRQHRHFCPWIASTNSGEPGWQQTLSALQRQKKDSHPTIPPSASMIKVDDPIASVRNLFMSPSSKRMKPTCGQS